MSTEELIKAVDEDDRWDSGELGCSLKYAKLANLTEEELKEINSEIENVNK